MNHNWDWVYLNCIPLLLQSSIAPIVLHNKQPQNPSNMQWDISKYLRSQFYALVGLLCLPKLGSAGLTQACGQLLIGYKLALLVLAEPSIMSRLWLVQLGLLCSAPLSDNEGKEQKEENVSAQASAHIKYISIPLPKAIMCPSQSQCGRAPSNAITLKVNNAINLLQEAAPQLEFSLVYFLSTAFSFSLNWWA